MDTYLPYIHGTESKQESQTGKSLQEWHLGASVEGQALETETRTIYYLRVFKIFRNHPWFFWISTAAAFALRLHFGLNRWAGFDGDALNYTKLATNLVQHHVYGLMHGAVCVPSMIRMPGYPLFMAAVYSVFGVGNYRALLLIQALFDLATCFIVADIARRLIGDRAARWTFAAAAVCPFIATYAGAVLTECLECFFTALAIDLAIVAFDAYTPGDSHSIRRALRFWALCGASVACAILLRPDGGLLLGSIGLVMIWQMFRQKQWKHYIAAGLLMATVALAPLVPWAIRNYRDFHVFQPLVDPYAIDPGEWEALGFNAWCYTWILDYSTTEDLTFRIDGDFFYLSAVPDRAYSDEAERMQVASMVAEYNKTLDMTRAMDAEFAKIAERHNREHPFKTKLLYPAIRQVTMWFRPRTEMLPLDTHWWAFEDDPHDSSIAIALGVVNALFLFAALAGAIKGFGQIRYLGLLIVFPILRSAMLWYLRTVEDRYTIECYPMVIVLAGYFVGTYVFKKKTKAEPSAVTSAVSS